MKSNLEVKSKRIWSWDIKDKCNDCDNDGHYIVKYPKLKEIKVCIDCYKDIYLDIIERSLNEAC